MLHDVRMETRDRALPILANRNDRQRSSTLIASPPISEHVETCVIAVRETRSGVIAGFQGLPRWRGNACRPVVPLARHRVEQRNRTAAHREDGGAALVCFRDPASDIVASITREDISERRSVELHHSRQDGGRRRFALLREGCVQHCYLTRNVSTDLVDGERSPDLVTPPTITGNIETGCPTSSKGCPLCVVKCSGPQLFAQRSC